MYEKEVEVDEYVIEAPSEADTQELARKLVHASEMVERIAGISLCGSEEDLDGIQAVLDSNTIEPEATYSLEALGVAFGCVFIENHAGFDWWMVSDEWGRTAAIRYKESRTLTFPQDMILKRVEDGVEFNTRELYEDLWTGLQEFLEEDPDVG